MPAPELSPDERILLAGMVRLVTCSDNQRTPEEMEEFRAIAEEVGRREFDEAFRLSMSRCHDLDAALGLAASIDRVDARQLILTMLVDLATADGVADEERRVVQALAAAWSMPVRL